MFRRVVIHWHIINSYWVIAIEGRGGMSQECVSMLQEINELANYGLEVARNLRTLEGEVDTSGKTQGIDINSKKSIEHESRKYSP